MFQREIFERLEALHPIDVTAFLTWEDMRCSANFVP
jgi:hypothetical protein